MNDDTKALLKQIESDVTEIEANAKRCSLGFFWRQYKKGDFVYTIEKRPLKKKAIVAVHVPTKTIFGYSPFLYEWEVFPFKYGGE